MYVCVSVEEIQQIKGKWCPHTCTYLQLEVWTYYVSSHTQHVNSQFLVYVILILRGKCQGHEK